MTLLYGFQALKDLVNRRVTEVGVEVVAKAIDATVAEHNRQMNALTRILVEPTTEFKTVFKSATHARLQPLDENGRARPIKPTGKYDLGYPIQSAGTAWGNTRISREKMTVKDANDVTAMLISADIRWMRDHLMAAVFDNAGWPFPDDEHGTLDVKGPANGDATLYTILSGADQGATDNHFKAQASAIDNSNNPFAADYEELMEHPENAGEAVAFVSTSIKASIEALTNFKEPRDLNIQTGSGSDVLVGTLGVQTPGKLVGYIDKVWIVEWQAVPSGYYFMTATQADSPIRMREHPEASLRGFSRVAERNDHPFYESQYERHAGFGAWNRVGLVVRRIGNGSYAVPTGYTVPMP